MSKVRGNNFRLFINSEAIPEETNASITLQGNTEDTSTKDVEGLASQTTVTSTSWNAQVDSYQAEPNQLRAILRMFNAATAVPVGFDQTSGTMNRTAAGADFAREGNALLNDFTMQFDDRTTVSCSLQFQGTGELATVN